MPDLAPPSTSEHSTPSPKVFISYSWTSPGHQDQVRKWAERLINDGVEVIIDIFDLKEGDDKYHFMETMVTDSMITHVLVICDNKYVEKANEKKAGVGTESQIISSEVYGKVKQSKFIPIACDFSDANEPSLPVFLKSRIWIDFSSPEAVNQNWEKLIRLLHGKPAFQKPQLGKPPSYLGVNTTSLIGPTIGKFATFKQAFLSGSKSLSHCRQDFLSACVDTAGTLRVKQPPEMDWDAFGKKILEDCTSLKDIRNQLIEWILLESGPTSSEEFIESLLRLLEELLELKARPVHLNGWNDSWFEAESLFVYETFLYIVAALLKTAAYSVLHAVFASHYLLPASQRSNDNFTNFGSFYGYSEVLHSVFSTGDRRLLSPAAELVKRQADRTDLPFSSIMEAELLILLMVFVMPQAKWFPQTLYYTAHHDFPFFMRAAQHRHFMKLATITGISDAAALRSTVKTAYERLDVTRWSGFQMQALSFWQLLNMDRMDSLQ